MAHDRSGGKAGQNITLQIRVQQNGVGTDVYDIGSVQLYDPLGNLIDTVTTIENVVGIGGLYQIQWDVPEGAELGRWSDVWRNIKVTTLAEDFDTTNYFFVVPDSQTLPTSNTTTVYMYAQYANGEPQEGVYGYAELLDTPYYLDGKYFNNPNPKGVRSTANSEGMLMWVLPQGARVRFSIPASDIVLLKQLPSSNSEVDVNSLGDLV